jgi:hypothetical protein
MAEQIRRIEDPAARKVEAEFWLPAIMYDNPRFSLLRWCQGCRVERPTCSYCGELIQNKFHLGVWMHHTCHDRYNEDIAGEMESEMEQQRRSEQALYGPW